MLKRLVTFLGWLIVGILVIAVFLREGVGLWGDIDYAVNEYRRLGGLGAMMEFILQPPPGVVLGALLLVSTLLLCLNWSRLSRFLLGRSDTQNDVAVLRERRLQHKQDQADRGIRGAQPQSPDWAMKEMCEYVFENLPDSNEVIREIQDKARLGILTVWGRLYSPMAVSQNHNPMKQIPQDHWDEYALNYLRCMAHSDPAECCTEPSGSRADIRGSYQDLKVNKKQAARIWPPIDKRKLRADRIRRTYAEAVGLRNNVRLMDDLPADSEARMDELQDQLIIELAELAPERSINLSTLNQYNEHLLPPVAMQGPKRQRVLGFSEFLRRVMKILEDYK